MDNKRLIIFLILAFAIITIWDNWEQRIAPRPAHVEQAANADSLPGAPATAALPADAVKDSLVALTGGDRISIKTDLINAVIDTQGGDLRRLELTQHHATGDRSKNFVLLDDSKLPKLVYISQTGLIGDDLPNHKSLYTATAKEYKLADNSDILQVKLSWDGGKGIQVDKVYTFHRGSYVIDLSYDIKNGSSTKLEPWAYYQLLHDSTPLPKAAMQTQAFMGAAYYTHDNKYKKLTFDDMGKADLSQNAKDGWIGVVQHYFASAWIPQNGIDREYYTKHLNGPLYAVGAKLAVGNIAPGATGNVTARLFSGPQEQAHLQAVAEGMDRTVDYGRLYVIAEPLFWLLSAIQKLVHNWGVAIILLTVLIKLVFYPLSAASYRSMAKMRKLAPRLQSLKERHGDDRVKLQQSMMELYKKEKINPMGGCLPILVQIPVFISLYWVLQGSIELRQAPFMLWITDLSAPDPYYVLPVIMAATMILQTRLNPTPPDPVQAKVMMIMPVVFSVFFFFFPAGLVLYWLVNNVLSILQQWHINRSIDGGRAAT